MVVKVVNNSKHALPQYESAQASGLDLRANIEFPVSLEPLERALIPTGLFIELPPQYEAQIRPRSGLAVKKGLTVLNSPGTIDADYRGEIKVVLVNVSNNKVIINDGERICQMVFQQVVRGELEPVEVLTESERGAGGFGHTGVK